MTTKLKPKFVVLKWDDVNKLSKKHYDQLDNICFEVEKSRITAGKSYRNHYVVINMDEPYIEEIKAIMTKYGHWEEV